MKARLKRVTDRTEAADNGSHIVCLCGKTQRIYHFDWSALTCKHCKEDVNKLDWRLGNGRNAAKAKRRTSTKLERVTHGTRAPEDGTVLRCPECKEKSGPVYHFDSDAIPCMRCHALIKKTDWFIDDPRDGSPEIRSRKAWYTLVSVGKPTPPRGPWDSREKVIIAGKRFKRRCLAQPAVYANTGKITIAGPFETHDAAHHRGTS